MCMLLKTIVHHVPPILSIHLYQLIGCSQQSAEVGVMITHSLWRRTLL